MTLELAGMVYLRAPQPGETVRCGVARSPQGRHIAARVYAGRELIAWDEIPFPPGDDRQRQARASRQALARRAADHWRAQGFRVEAREES